MSWNEGSGQRANMMTTSRILIWAAAAAFLAAQTLAPAHASTVTYDLKLNASGGGDGGPGSLTLNSPASGIFTAGNGGITSLSIFVDGSNFTLNNATIATVNGGILSLVYSGFVGS